MTKTSLGCVVGHVLKAWQEMEDDPISHYYGFYPDLRPALLRIIHSHGWTVLSILRELKERGVSEKWIYNSSLGFLEGSPDSPRSWERHAAASH